MNINNYEDLCEAMCGKERLYIMSTSEGEGYQWTGYVSAWYGKHTIDGNHVEDSDVAYLLIN